MEKKSLEAHIASEGIHLTTARGQSMLPYLRNNDLVTIESINQLEALKEGDIVLYRRKNKVLVLHRIFQKKEGQLILNGDSQTYFESILPEQVIGILTSFQRKGHRYFVDSWSHQLYQMLWIRPYRWRFFLLKVMRKIKRKR